MAVDDALTSPYNDRWATEPKDSDTRQKIHAVWEQLPDKNKAWFEVIGVVAYEDILDIDDLGDEFAREPHIYVQFRPKRGPFLGWYKQVESRGPGEQRLEYVSDEYAGRIKVFADEFRLRKETEDSC